MARPTTESLLDLVRRITPREWHEPILNDAEGSAALLRSLGKIWSFVADRVIRQVEGQYMLPYPLQLEAPASSGAYAEADVEVTLTRDRAEPRFVAPGMMRIEAIGGRIFANVDAVQWDPFDPLPAKTIRIRCDVPGEIGNLDFIADQDGLVTAFGGGPDGDLVALADQSKSRTSMNGSIVATSANSIVYDDGRNERFDQNDVGLYLRIENASNPENIGRLLLILSLVDAEIESPDGSGLYPRGVVVDDSSRLARLTVAQLDDGGVFSVQTNAAASAVASDVTLTAATPVVGDAYYFGAVGPFSALRIDLDTAGSWVGTIAWEYWTGAAWAALPDVVDATHGFTAAGRGVVRWSVPTGWASTSVNSLPAYYVRARVSAFTSIATRPLASVVLATLSTKLTPESGTVTWAIVDWADQGFALTQIGAPTGGRDNALFLLGRDRGQQQQSGETDDNFRSRLARCADGVSPNAIRKLVNRHLQAYNREGLALDAEDYGRWYWDRDFFDYYDDGDAFPVDRHRVWLTDSELHGGIIILVPQFSSSAGIGFAWDNGPAFSVGGESIGPAWDHLVWDGVDQVAPPVYRAIYDAVLKARAWPFRVILRLDPTLNTPEC